jgi:hypothetical protein
MVGWFPDATVYRHEQPSNAKERNLFSYFVKTRAEKAVLVVPESRRKSSFQLVKAVLDSRMSVMHSMMRITHARKHY